MSKREKLSVAGTALRAFATAPQNPLTRGVDPDGDGVRLVEDIISIFRQRNVDRLRTSILVKSLSAIEDRRWFGESRRNAQRLAQLLRPLHIRPKTVRFKDGTAKGYLRMSFEKVLIRVAEIDASGTHRS
jgi:hypothetical protein